LRHLETHRNGTGTPNARVTHHVACVSCSDHFCAQSGAAERLLPYPIGSGIKEKSDMGDLLDRLNAMDPYPHAPGEPIKSVADRGAEAIRSAGQWLNEAIETIQEPDMPVDIIRRATRQAPVQALAIAFLVGVLFVRRR
jgi:hypothetical protein